MEKQVITQTFLPLDLFSQNKVRDTYLLSMNYLLMIATDRISAFDVILPNGIPGKGKVLNQLSVFWFIFFRETNIVDDHFITADFEKISAMDNRLARFNYLDGRSMIVKRYNPLPIECVVRGYITGSGWKDYKKDGKVCGIELPVGLKESDILKEVIFTPATKAKAGHDENIFLPRANDIVNAWIMKNMPTCPKTGAQVVNSVRDISLHLYNIAKNYALKKGIIIADTKLEFALTEDGQLILIDEVFTPDSSRFWPAGEYEPGRPQKSFDKQYVRDYLNEIGWDRKPPPPSLPSEIIFETSKKYQEAFQMLTS